MASIVATLGQKGGSGKSSAARLLAVELASRGRKVVMVDLDIRQRTVSEWSAARELNELEPRIEVVQVDHEREPDFRLPELLREGAEVIVADAPGWMDRSFVELASRADLCLLPTACSEDELRPTIRLFHDLIAEGIPATRIAILLNRVGTQAESKRARLKIKEGEVPSMSVIETELPELPIYRSGQDGGQAASEVSIAAPREKAAAVAAELIARLEAARPAVEPKRFRGGRW